MLAIWYLDTPDPKSQIVDVGKCDHLGPIPDDVGHLPFPGPEGERWYTRHVDKVYTAGEFITLIMRMRNLCVQSCLYVQGQFLS